MKKLLFSFIAFLLALHINCIAQVKFQKRFGIWWDETTATVRQTADGGYIIGCSYTDLASQSNIALVKTNANGDTLWRKIYGGQPGGDEIHWLEQTADGGYIFTGRTSSTGFGTGSYLCIVKTNTIGDTLWTKSFKGSSFGSSEPYSCVKQTSDGGYIIAADLYDQNGWNLGLLKTDAAGDTLWTRRFGHTIIGGPVNVFENNDGGYITAGQYNSGMISIVRTNSVGDTLWAHLYKDSSSIAFSSMVKTSDNGYIIAGTKTVSGSTYDFFIMKIDSSGNVGWAKTLGGTLMATDIPYAIQQTGDGGCLIAGMTVSFGSGGQDGYLVKTDSTGNPLWSKTYGSTLDDRITSMIISNDGGIMLVGKTKNFSSVSNDIYFIKTDASGNSGCNETIPPTIAHPAFPVIDTASTVIYPDTIFFSTTSIPFTQTPSGGGGTLCFTSGINEIDDDNLFVISENPSGGTFQITFSKMIVNGEIEVYNVTGGKVYDESIFNSLTKHIHLKNCSDGIYLLKVYDGSKHFVRKILVKQD